MDCAVCSRNHLLVRFYSLLLLIQFSVFLMGPAVKGTCCSYRGCSLLPSAHMKQFTIASNSSSRAPGIYMYIHINKLKYFKISFFFSEMGGKWLD